MGAISQQTSPLPSESLSYPSPTQDPVAPPKRVVVGRTLALRLHLRPYLTPASKNQVQPSSGCRQGAISLQTSPLPSESLSYPSPTQDPVAPPKQVVVGRTAALRLRLCYCLTTASKNQVQPSLGCRQGGDFTTNLATALGLSSLPVAHPRPRRSTKTSRRRTYSSATAPSSSVPNTCKQKTGSTQLGVPTWGQFHNKPRRCPLSLSPTRHPPKTPLLHQNESSLAVR